MFPSIRVSVRPDNSTASLGTCEVVILSPLFLSCALSWPAQASRSKANGGCGTFHGKLLHSICRTLW